MEKRRRQRSPESDASDPDSVDDGPLVKAHTTTPDRVVFTEQGNTDGWIATDLVVDSWR